MTIGKKMTCEICLKVYSFYGLASHIRSNHSISYDLYKKRYLCKKGYCLTCNKEIFYPRQYCSNKCYDKTLLEKKGILSIDRKLGVKLEDYKIKKG